MIADQNPALVDANLDCMGALCGCLSFADYRAGKAPRTVNHGSAQAWICDQLELAKTRGLMEYAGDHVLPDWNRSAWVCSVRLTEAGIAVARAYHADAR
jgi:hypothetical protein